MNRPGDEEDLKDIIEWIKREREEAISEDKLAHSIVLHQAEKWLRFFLQHEPMWRNWHTHET